MAHGSMPEDEAYGQWSGDEDHDRRQEEGGEECDLERDVGDHDAEEDERQEHGHLRGGLPIVEEAVAQIEVQERDRETCGESGQKAVTAQALSANEGEQHEPYAV